MAVAQKPNFGGAATTLQLAVMIGGGTRPSFIEAVREGVPHAKHERGISFGMLRYDRAGTRAWRMSAAVFRHCGDMHANSTRARFRSVPEAAVKHLTS